MSRLWLIGQRLSRSGSRTVARALAQRDTDTIAGLARRQAEAGAHYLDIGAGGEPEDAEAGALAWLVEAAQRGADLPLCLDSRNPAALGEAVAQCLRPAILNSLSGRDADSPVWQALLRAHNDLPLVLLCYDGQDTRTAVAERLAIAGRLVGLARQCGLPEANLILDPVTLPAAYGPESRRVTLSTMQALRARFPEAGILCAAGNFGYGLANRREHERAFAHDARQAGADVFLCDVLDPLLPPRLPDRTMR